MKGGNSFPVSKEESYDVELSGYVMTNNTDIYFGLDIEKSDWYVCIPILGQQGMMEDISRYNNLLLCCGS